MLQELESKKYINLICIIKMVLSKKSTKKSIFIQSKINLTISFNVFLKSFWWMNEKIKKAYKRFFLHIKLHSFGVNLCIKIKVKIKNQLHQLQLQKLNKNVHCLYEMRKMKQAKVINIVSILIRRMCGKIQKKQRYLFNKWWFFDGICIIICFGSIVSLSRDNSWTTIGIKQTHNLLSFCIYPPFNWI